MEFFFKQGGQEGGDRNKPFKSSLCEAHKDISTEQIREWIYTVSILCGSGPQRGIQAPLGAPRPFEGFQEIKNNLYNNTEILFALFTVPAIWHE